MRPVLLILLLAASCATTKAGPPATPPEIGTSPAQPPSASGQATPSAADQPAAQAAGGAVVEAAPQPDPGLDRLGPYALGTTYDELKAMPGFEADEKRTDAAGQLAAGRIIDKKILGVPTIQRLVCKAGKLRRVSVIFGPVEVTEELAKGWAARSWGDPGAKKTIGDSQHYVWQVPGRLAMVLPADGGRWMVSLTVNDAE